jgi:hypothetical protein
MSNPLHYVSDAVVRKFVPVSMRYEAAKRGYLSRHPMTNGAYQGAEQPIVDEIRREGIYIWQDFIPRDEAIRIGEKARPMLEAVRDGSSKYPNQTLRDLESGLYRIKNADNLITEAKTILDDERIKNIAKGVTTPDVRSHMRMVEMREGVASACSEDCWHFDEPYKYKFKFFLLLTDVNEDNAPFAYVKRSHIGGKWRRKKELDAFHYGLTGDWGFFHQHEYDGVMKRWGKPLGWEKIVCTGKAGTMILFDANGLHRRELCRSGSRIVMSNYYEA